LIPIAIVTGEPAEIDAIAARLEGATLDVAADHRSLTIVDVAGEGAPEVGVVVRDGKDLVLVTAERRLVLRGPLARPRIAGPGYTVWVTGAISPDGASITAHRLGILRRP
jgi:hypothetical protein